MTLHKVTVVILHGVVSPDYEILQAMSLRVVKEVAKALLKVMEMLKVLLRLVRSGNGVRPPPLLHPWSGLAPILRQFLSRVSLQCTYEAASIGALGKSREKDTLLNTGLHAPPRTKRPNTRTHTQYRGISLTRNSPHPKEHHRTLGIVLL